MSSSNETGACVITSYSIHYTKLYDRAEGAADQHGDLRHRGGGDGGHHLGTVARDALVFIFPADHEARDILQEDQRDAALRAKLDEMRGLLLV